MKTTEKKTTSQDFANVIQQYEQQATQQTDTTAYTNALVDLAKAVTYSVLKKCISVSQDKTLIQTRQDLTRDLHTLDGIAYANNNAYETRYTINGDRHTAIIDKELHKVLITLYGQTLGDGLDLLNTAIVCILSETDKAKDRNGGTLPPKFMEQPYTVRRLNRKVWIKTAESVNGWETTTTTAIQETYKAVRRYIESNRALKSASNIYIYLDETATDSKSDTADIIYRRFGKYADIGGTVTDYNGKETFYTTDEQTVKDIDTIIEKLNLTAKQAKILQLRLSGDGYKAIATYLGITQRAVAKTVKAIQAKAVEIGLNPETADTITD